MRKHVAVTIALLAMATTAAVSPVVEHAVRAGPPADA